MELTPELEQALRDVVAAWDEADRAPRDGRLRRRAMERTAIFVELARRALDRTES